LSLDALFAFIGALLLWIAVPGPAILMIIGRSLAVGFRSTLSLVGGVLLGDLFYMSLVFLGLAALGRLMGEFFVVVRVLAALYLIYLGISLWLRKPKAPSELRASPGDSLKSFLTGFGITLGNPKAILFHLGFLPTFFDLPALTLGEALTIMAVFATVLGGAFLAYALGASLAGRFFRSPSRMRFLNSASGTLLIGAGAFVLFRRG